MAASVIAIAETLAAGVDGRASDARRREHRSGAQRLQSDELSTTRIQLGYDYPVHKIWGFECQFCLLPLFALARFGVSVGNPQSGGDRFTIAFGIINGIRNNLSE